MTQRDGLKEAPRGPQPHRTTIELPEWEGYQRTITTRGAYDQRDSNPSRDYGISGVTITFALIGKDRALDWDLLTDCFLPHTNKRLRKVGRSHGGPTAGGVGFHYSEEQYEGMMSSETCTLLDGRCFYDTGFLIGDEVYRAWAYGGIDGVFGKLREILEAPE